jgi:signal transduction histidine kinase
MRVYSAFFRETPDVGDSRTEIDNDVAAIGRIDAVPTLLRVICETTGMRFAAVARVTAGTWTACAVHDDLDFGLKPGGQLDIDTTLCKEAREARAPIAIDQASTDATYRDHHTPHIYGIESYISVPIVLRSGEYFGNLCAIDPLPAKVSEPRILSLFTLFAELIALQLENDRSREAQRTALVEERAEADRREQFIAILGHDLRGPLGGILAGAEFLQRPGGASESQVVMVARRIAASARRMSGLVSDVLDVAKGRVSGGFSVRMSDVHDVDEALREVVSELQQAHPSRTFIVDIDAPHEVHCDRDRVQQLVSNLLQNALTHGSADGPITVSAKVTDGYIALTVTNTGPPIPEASLPHLFEPFWRRSAAPSREGLGLGLFICAEIVRAHGGRIEVVSSLESGTTFAARLPLSPGASVADGSRGRRPAGAERGTDRVT